ncbi:MAG: hypothetical protein ACK4RM_02015 [Flavobacterium sp.]
MIEQLSQLMNQFGQEAVVKNNSVPNELNDKVIKEAQSSLYSGLQDLIQDGGAAKFATLLQGNNASKADNPIVKGLIDKVSNNLNKNCNLDSGASNNVANNLIPQVLGSLLGKAKDPNQKGFELSDIIGSLTNGRGNDIMGILAKMGLDQNGDGKLDIQDAMAALSGKGGKKAGGLLGKFFGK